MEITTEQNSLESIDWRFKEAYDQVGYEGLVELLDYMFINQKMNDAQGKEFAVKHKLTRRNAKVYAWTEFNSYYNKYRLSIQMQSRQLINLYSTRKDFEHYMEVIRNYEARKLTTESA